MDLFRNAYRRVPGSAQLPSNEKGGARRQSPMASLQDRLAILKRPVRLRGNSSISVPLGVIVVFPCIVIILILVLFVKHPASPGRILMPAGAPPAIRKISEEHDKVFVTGCLEPDTSKPRANGAFVVLARNKELDGVIQSVKSIERHFNRWYHYPYVFLNDAEFNQTFKDTIRNYTSGHAEFGQVEPGTWGFPDWIDRKVAKEGIAKQGDAAVMYGGLESYHAMCRFYSGFFYNHPLLDKYEWYWRLEPEITYFCDITYDPFLAMIENNKTYGFTIAVKELRETVPNIFRYASAYKRLNNITSQGLWEMFVEPREKPTEVPEDDPNYKPPLPEEILRTDPGRTNLPEIDPEAMEGESYNMCHFWSNFEIARLSWFRSKEYQDFFEMMDRSGGFWMERWGDAPIHSLAAGILLAPRDIHYFRDFGALMRALASSLNSSFCRLHQPSANFLKAASATLVPIYTRHHHASSSRPNSRATLFPRNRKAPGTRAMASHGTLPTAASEGFKNAAAYDQYRPSYPPAAVDEFLSKLKVANQTDATIVEVAAGTGKFTELLASRPERFLIKAVEPHDGMRGKLVDKDLPAVQVTDGRADGMPVDEEWGDACIAAQAFHWFATPESLVEIHRVLRPGAVFGMIWNVEDYNKPLSWKASTKWEQKLNDWITKFQDGNPRFRDGEWRNVFEKQLPGNPLQVIKNTLTDHLPRFSLPLGEHSVPFTVWLTEEALWSRLQTLSQIAILEGEDQENAKKIVKDALQGDDVERNEKGEVAVHGVTFFAWTDRI